MKAAMLRLGMEEDVPIESGMVSRSIERAQKQVEQRNFETRKHLLEYDDVNNKQRQEIYGLRRDLLEGKEQKEYVLDRAREILNVLVDDYVVDKRIPRSGSSTPARADPALLRARHREGGARTSARSARRARATRSGPSSRRATSTRKGRSVPTSCASTSVTSSSRSSTTRGRTTFSRWIT
jgi:hypothetical protein